MCDRDLGQEPSGRKTGFHDTIRPMVNDSDPRHPEETGKAAARELTTQHIGRLGELLVQYELLRCGIDSAPMTTDSGVDIVAYSATRGRSFTIQVKTNLAPKPGGGKGAPAFDWWVAEDCPAEIYALADISTRRVWLFTKHELSSTAQQRSSGRLHLYMYSNSAHPSWVTHATVMNVFKVPIREPGVGLVL